MHCVKIYGNIAEEKVELNGLCMLLSVFHRRMGFITLLLRKATLNPFPGNYSSKEKEIVIG
jgi:hypothetical protein